MHLRQCAHICQQLHGICRFISKIPSLGIIWIVPPALTWLLRVPEIKSVEQLGSSELAMNRWRVPESFSQLFEALATPRPTHSMPVFLKSSHHSSTRYLISLSNLTFWNHRFWLKLEHLVPSQFSLIDNFLLKRGIKAKVTVAIFWCPKVISFLYSLFHSGALGALQWEAYIDKS